MPLLPRRSRTATWFISSIILLALLIGHLVGQQPTAFASQERLLWSMVVGLPTTVHLRDVFMVDTHGAWAVGESKGQGVIYRLSHQRDHWEVSFEASFPEPLYAIVAPSETNVWVVGDKGLIARKEQTGWRVVAHPAPAANLRTIQMFGAGEEGWAGGFFPPQSAADSPQVVLLHYQDGEWRQEHSVQGIGQINDLHFISQGGWAVGNDIWKYQNGTWSKEPEPNACGTDYPCPHELSSVRALSVDEAWAVGSRVGICAICVPRPYALHRINGAWQQVNVPTGSNNPQSTAILSGGSFSQDGSGLLVGWYNRGIIDQTRGTIDGLRRPLLLRYQGQRWQLEPLPVKRGTLVAVSVLTSTHALAVGREGLILAYGYGLQPHPTTRVSDPLDSGRRYFEPVGHTLGGVFRSYWERNGGLFVFGYPLTEEFRELNSDTGHPYTVQYLERQRYEHHPELRGTPYEVLLGRLGVELLLHQGRDWQTFPKATPTAPHYYSQTGQAIAEIFWGHWRSQGLELDNQAGVSEAESIALFGYPISEARQETNSSGDTVLTQWFERARFEYHPDNPEPYRVLLGRLGAEFLAERGW